MTVTTQQRVLDTSMALFNAHGVEAISVGQIAETMGISPGNLTYHYRRKTDLIRAHFDRFERDASEALETFPVEADAKAVAAALFDFMTLAYGYRFLFLGAGYIIKHRLIAPRRFHLFVERARRIVVRQVERLVEQGHMPPFDAPLSVELMVDGIWWQWLGRLLAMQITPPSPALSPPALVADGIVRVVLGNPHYADLSFFRAMRVETERLAAEAH